MIPPIHPDPESTRDKAIAGRPIVAGDGRAWHFAGPVDSIAPEVSGVESPDRPRLARVIRRAILGVRGRRALAELLEAVAVEDHDGADLAAMALAMNCLQACHRISDGQAAEVLTFPSAEWPGFVRQLAELAIGIPPEGADHDTIDKEIDA